MGGGGGGKVECMLDLKQSNSGKMMGNKEGGGYENLPDEETQRNYSIIKDGGKGDASNINARIFTQKKIRLMTVSIELIMYTTR